MKKLLIFLPTLLFMISCQPSDTEKTVTVDKKYSLSIPSFLTEVSNLNEDASLQYQHAFKEFYLIAIDEPKESIQRALISNNLTDRYSNDINGYSDLLIDGFSQNIAISNQSAIIDTVINKLPAKVLSLSGKIEGIDAFYYLAFIEGKHRYYQIMTWTLSSREYEYKNKMANIIYSFKEL